MASDQTVQTIFEVVDKTSKKVDEMSKSLKGYGKTTEDVDKKQKGLAEGLKSKIPLGAAAAGAAIATLVVGVTKAAIELGEVGAKSEFVRKNFEKFASSVGKNSDSMVKELRSATQGMISDMELQQFAMQSMVSGVDFDDMITAMQFVSRQAAATGADVSQKMQTVMTGFARGSAQFLDDVGIQVMGAEDVVGAAIVQMKEKMDLFADASGTAQGNIVQTKAEINNLKAAIGENLTPVTEAWGNIIVAVLTKVADAAKLITAKDDLDEMNRLLEEQEKRNANILAYDEARKQLSEDTLAEYSKIMGELQEIEKLGGESKAPDRYRAAFDALERMKKEWFTIMDIERDTGADIAAGYRIVQQITEEKKAQALLDKERKNAGGKGSGKSETKEEIDWLLELEAIQGEQRNKRNSQIAQDAINKMVTAKKVATIEEELILKNLEVDKWATAEMKRVDEEYFEWRKQKRQENIDSLMNSAAMVVGGINAISSARQKSTDQWLSKELDAINSSRMSEKKKEDARKKAEETAQEQTKKSAMVAWGASAALATAQATQAIISTIANTPTGPLGKMAAGALIGAEVFGLVAQMAASKPRFYNGGEIGSNGRVGDSQLAMVRSNERVLTPEQNREWKVSQNRVNNNDNRSISYSPNVYVQGGDPEMVKRAMYDSFSQVLEESDRNGRIDWVRLDGLQRNMQGV
jgi:hypothetical protein